MCCQGTESGPPGARHRRLRHRLCTYVAHCLGRTGPTEPPKSNGNGGPEPPKYGRTVLGKGWFSKSGWGPAGHPQGVQVKKIILNMQCLLFSQIRPIHVPTVINVGRRSPPTSAVHWRGGDENSRIWSLHLDTLKVPKLVPHPALQPGAEVVDPSRGKRRFLRVRGLESGPPGPDFEGFPGQGRG